MLILNFGYSKFTGILLNRIKERFNLRHPFAPVDLFTKHPVLIIPSGALAGIENSEGFKKTLEEYVKQGGTIICFSQQRGYEFSALPGGENLSDYGWIEDQACWYRYRMWGQDPTSTSTERRRHKSLVVLRFIINHIFF